MEVAEELFAVEVEVAVEEEHVSVVMVMVEVQSLLVKLVLFQMPKNFVQKVDFDEEFQLYYSVFEKCNRQTSAVVCLLTVNAVAEKQKNFL